MSGEKLVKRGFFGIWEKCSDALVAPAGFEPATLCLEGRSLRKHSNSKFQNEFAETASLQWFDSSFESLTKYSCAVCWREPSGEFLVKKSDGTLAVFWVIPDPLPFPL